MNVVLLGAPGAGKGTQAQHIRKAAGIPHIATGDMLRAAAAEGTQVGLRARSYMDRGELVPDEVVVAIVAERLSQPDCRSGWLLDGFPRTGAQAEALDRTIWERGLRPMDHVIYLSVSPETVVERLSGRRVCPNTECGTAYHLEFLPPKKDSVCDRCGTGLIRRDDDVPETVRSRLETYESRTAGLVARYREAGLLVEIDASGTPEEVAEQVLEALGPIPEPAAEPVEVPPGNASAAPGGAAAGASAKETAAGKKEAVALSSGGPAKPHPGGTGKQDRAALKKSARKVAGKTGKKPGKKPKKKANKQAKKKAKSKAPKRKAPKKRAGKKVAKKRR